MATHYKTAGHLACGRHGDTLTTSRILNRVDCRNCRNTEAYKEARRQQRNAARRAARKAKSEAAQATDWRSAWRQRLTELPGKQRLPRCFHGQPYV